jgi:CheY-like chemotaxis protein
VKKKAAKNDTSHIANAKVLLVEDNELNRLLAYTILTQYGALVTSAENGAIAIECLRKQKFDIVLMDVQMPVMDGITATRIIREEMKNDVPVIALTANAIKGKKEEYMQAGMNDYIAKPYNEEKMIAVYLSQWFQTLIFVISISLMMMILNLHEKKKKISLAYSLKMVTMNLIGPAFVSALLGLISPGWASVIFLILYAFRSMFLYYYLHRYQNVLPD